MPTALTAPPPSALPIAPPHKLWTRAQCEQLDRAGLLDQQRLELVEGELINKMGKHRPHVNAQVFLLIWLGRTTARSPEAIFAAIRGLGCGEVGVLD